jgi:hypothetical protein
MKILPAVLASSLQGRRAKANLQMLRRILMVLALLVAPAMVGDLDDPDTDVRASIGPRSSWRPAPTRPTRTSPPHSASAPSACRSWRRRPRRESRLLFLAEGLDVFTAPMPSAIAGRTLAEANLRALTGCNVLGARASDGTIAHADPKAPLLEQGELILLGDRNAEQRFLDSLGVGSGAASEAP